MKIILNKSKNKLIKKFIVLKLIKNEITCFNDKKKVEILKLFKVILKFYLNNKKILFIGVTKKVIYFFKFMSLFKNIAYLSRNLWVKGLLTNSFVLKSLCFSKKRKSLKLLFNFLPDYDLIVNFDLLINNKEILKFKKPVINLYKYLTDNVILNSKLLFNNQSIFFLYFIHQIILKFKNVN